MKYIVLLFLSVSLFADPSYTQKDERLAREIGQDINRHGMQMRIRTNVALDAIIRVMVGELRNKAYTAEAEQIEKEWNEQYSFFILRRDLGDHKPLSDWLANTYAKVESLLGVFICQQLHLDDINVLNYSIPIVFHPCDYPMDFVSDPRRVDYACHFVGTSKHGGFAPVVAYWTSYAACVVGTSGTGFVWACSTAADGCKWVMKKWVAPPLSNKIQDRCEQ